MMTLSLVSAKTLTVLTAATVLAAVQPVTMIGLHESGVAPLETLATERLLQDVSFHAALTAGEVEGIPFADWAALQRFYDERDNDPIFLSGDEPLAQARALLGVFEESWTHGLNPESYHVEPIRRLLTSPLRLQMEQARLELLLADAVMRYGRDMTGMRVDPAQIKQQAKFWRQPVPGYDVLSRVAAADDFAAALEELAPHTMLYRKLREELVRLSTAEEHYEDLLPLDFGAPYFHPGKKAPAVVGLRQRLGVAVPSNVRRADLYVDELAAAVMAFQRRYEVEPDGIIGPQTLSLLNRTRQAQMEQVIANLERLRWMPADLPDRYVMVNIPSQMLWGVDHGKVALEMPVVVGLPFRQTQSFTTDVTGIRLNPTWTVPLSLKMQDFLPKLKENPGYLAEKGIELIQGYGKNARTLDPAAIDWDTIGWREMGKLRMVQVPGDHNALGRVRVLMDNEFDIYMHDTNHPEFFDKTQRTYSSGCIRLSRPYDMARFVMQGHEGWSEEAMQDILAAGETEDLEIGRTMPVYIVYQTIWLNGHGDMVFGADVYGRDRKLLAALRAAGQFVLPGDDHAARYASVNQP